MQLISLNLAKYIFYVLLLEFTPLFLIFLGFSVFQIIKLAEDFEKSWYPVHNPNKVWVGNLTPQPSINEVTKTFKNVGKTARGEIFLSVG